MTTEDIIFSITFLLNRPYAEVAQECQEICAMSTKPSSEMLPVIYARVAGGETLSAIHEDFSDFATWLESLL